MANHTSVQESIDPFPRQQKVIRGISFSPPRLLAELAELVQYRDLILTLRVHRLTRLRQLLSGKSFQNEDFYRDYSEFLHALR